VRSESGSLGQGWPSLILRAVSRWETRVAVSQDGFFLFSQLYMYSVLRRFWDWDKVRKVCRYFPAGVLARLLTQVLLCFGLFRFLFFVFPSLPPRLEQRRTGHSMVHTHGVGNKDNSDGRQKNGLTWRFFPLLGELVNLDSRHVCFALGVHQIPYPKGFNSTFFLSARPFIQGGSLIHITTGSVFAHRFHEQEGFYGDGSERKEALWFCGPLSSLCWVYMTDQHTKLYDGIRTYRGGVHTITRPRLKPIRAPTPL
jgi:hypothetical protein